MPAGRPRTDVQLSHCREEGIQCRDCVHRTAASVAKICNDVTPSLARQLFPVLFPESPCAQMSGAFVQAVIAQQASQPARIPRRMPGRELRPVAVAAVAVA